eukprot:Nk52_evm1s408 gene=Nk52_evmTU1s408
MIPQSRRIEAEIQKLLQGQKPGGRGRRRQRERRQQQPQTKGEKEKEESGRKKRRMTYGEKMQQRLVGLEGMKTGKQKEEKGGEEKWFEEKEMREENEREEKEKEEKEKEEREREEREKEERGREEREREEREREEREREEREGEEREREEEREEREREEREREEREREEREGEERKREDTKREEKDREEKKREAKKTEGKETEGKEREGKEREAKEREAKEREEKDRKGRERKERAEKEEKEEKEKREGVKDYEEERGKEKEERNQEVQEEGEGREEEEEELCGKECDEEVYREDGQQGKKSKAEEHQDGESSPEEYKQEGMQEDGLNDVGGDSSSSDGFSEFYSRMVIGKKKEKASHCAGMDADEGDDQGRDSEAEGKQYALDRAFLFFDYETFLEKHKKQEKRQQQRKKMKKRTCGESADTPFESDEEGQSSFYRLPQPASPPMISGSSPLAEERGERKGRSRDCEKECFWESTLGPCEALFHAHDDGKRGSDDGNYKANCSFCCKESVRARQYSCSTGKSWEDDEYSDEEYDRARLASAVSLLENGSDSEDDDSANDTIFKRKWKSYLRRVSSSQSESGPRRGRGHHDSGRNAYGNVQEWEDEYNAFLADNGLPPIFIVNKVDGAAKPSKFRYVTQNIRNDSKLFEQQVIVKPPRGCSCVFTKDGITRDANQDSGNILKHAGSERVVNTSEMGKYFQCCPVGTPSKLHPAYDRTGILRVPPRTLIYECNRFCSCASSLQNMQNCYNRVVQRGRTFPLELFRTKEKGWGVRAVTEIPKGSFVVEYVGQLVPTKNASRRNFQLDTYLLDMDVVGIPLYTIDASTYGNIARFINHSCDPNLVYHGCWTENWNERLPRMALFASRNISPGEELAYDYQLVQQEEPEYPCRCGAKNCKKFLL